LSKFYNKSQDKLSNRTNFNPDFWEVRVEQNILDQFSLEADLHYESEEDILARSFQRDWVSKLIPKVLELMDDVLTERQREIVHLYFFKKMTEEEIAQKLGISISSVSQHLFGKRRNDKVVGGALQKLRKVCKQKGLGL